MRRSHYVTRAVAGAKTPTTGTPLTHAVSRVSGLPLCTKVKPESILDDALATDENAPPTCPACVRILGKLLI